MRQAAWNSLMTILLMALLTAAFTFFLIVPMFYDPWR